MVMISGLLTIVVFVDDSFYLSYTQFFLPISEFLLILHLIVIFCKKGINGNLTAEQDDGDTFTYTGSGGRDLSGNKRTAEQSCDQTLTRMNRLVVINQLIDK